MALGAVDVDGGGRREAAVEHIAGGETAKCEGANLPILLFAVPFVFAVGALGMVVAALFRSPLAIQLASAAIGLPFFFLAGFAWPPEAIPESVRALAALIPSSFAIDGFVRLAQLNGVAVVLMIKREF